MGDRQRLPRRRLIDWTPEDGDGQAWLARLADEGWVPEHRTGADVVVNGRHVRRFAMIERGAGHEETPRPSGEGRGDSSGSVSGA